MTIKLIKHNLKETVIQAAAILKSGGLIIAPTDTLYGLLCPFSNKEAVEKIYKLKGRDSDKRLLALVNSAEMAKTICQINPENELINRWPGPLTLIFAVNGNHPYDWDTQAIRYPQNEFINLLVKEIGEPIFAPSANPQGNPPAKSIEAAISYFGSSVPLYIDNGELIGEASTLVDASQKENKILRQGAMNLDNYF